MFKLQVENLRQKEVTLEIILKIVLHFSQKPREMQSWVKMKQKVDEGSLSRYLHTIYISTNEKKECYNKYIPRSYILLKIHTTGWSECFLTSCNDVEHE